ncbi:ModD protein [Desulfovulcanus sp.]
MIYFSDSELDRYIAEDLPYADLTSFTLGLSRKQKARLTYTTREITTICGTEEVSRICQKFSLVVHKALPSGTTLEKGETFFVAEGGADGVHKAWRLGNIWLEYASGIATRTKKMVDLARGVNLGARVVTTRKNMPFTKKLSIKAVLAGGGLPHRLGLSETILIFDEHIRFLGGIEGLVKKLPAIRENAPEKKITVEVHNMDDALTLARVGVDILQLDKFSLEDTKKAVKMAKEINPHIEVAIAGGVNINNVEEFARAGVVLMVTSWPYFGKPADIKSEIIALS